MRQFFVAQLVVFLVIALLVPGVAKAQNKRTPEELAKLEEQAWKAADSGDFKKAIAIWEEIMDEIAGEGRNAIQKNLASAYLMLKEYPASWYYLTTYLENTSRKDVKAARQLEKLERKLNSTHRKVFITCDPEAASVYFGLEATGTAYKCPITWWFKPGKQFVYVTKDGFRPQSAQYDVRERGEKGAWTVKLAELPQYGVLVVKGEGKAIQVFLNGMLEGKVPFKRKLKQGTYELMVGQPGKMPWKKTVEVKPNQTTVEEPPPAQPTAVPGGAGKASLSGADGKTDGTVTIGAVAEPEKAPSKVGPIVVLASGVGFVAAGAILQIVGASKEGDVYARYKPGAWGGAGDPATHNEAVHAAQAEYEAAYSDEVQPFKTTSYVLYGVGGAAAVAGAVWLALQSGGSEKDKGQITVAPLVARDLVGASVGFEF